MYPAHYLSLFPPFPRDDRVFVAMSFDPAFRPRWDEVIAPAVRSVEVEGRSLEPFRVDTRVVGDSILTEILDGIGRARLVFADVSTIGFIGEGPVRNANVLYELGIAHAARLPEEVVVFRSDQDRLLFDVSNARVNAYDPDNAATAREDVASALRDALREVDLRRGLAVRWAAERLDFHAMVSLVEASKESIHPLSKGVIERQGPDKTPSIDRLLEVGALVSKVSALRNSGDGELFRGVPFVRYEITPFGEAVLAYLVEQLGLDEEEREQWLNFKPSGEGAS